MGCFFGHRELIWGQYLQRAHLGRASVWTLRTLLESEDRLSHWPKKHTSAVSITVLMLTLALKGTSNSASTTALMLTLALKGKCFSVSSTVLMVTQA